MRLPWKRRGWRPKLVALDIDGTVVDLDGVMPDPVHSAVRRVIDAGVPVVMSTGRSWLATRPIIEAFDLPHGLHVTSNGAVVSTFPPLHVVHEVTFDPTDVIQKVRAETDALIAVEEVGVGYRVSAEFPTGELYGQCRVQTLEELMATPVSRVIVRDPNAADGEFIELAERLGLHGVQYWVGWSAWLDIAPKGVHKAAGLDVVCARMDVDRADVLALGDGFNDLEMLAWAGRGVAIGDAADEVKAAADHVTGTFAEGGTVAELDRWFG
jgi:HAD superfamily hydrolase (TIGR01484 family)